MVYEAQRNHISTVLLFFFLIILGISASISEFFQAPMSEVRKLERYRHLFPSQRWVDLKAIELVNTMGSLRLELNGSEWSLTNPRRLPANPKAVNRVVSELKQVVIKKIYPNDKINSANFSLNNPLFTIRLMFVGEEERTIRVGLVNPVDNSTYVTLSGGSNAIYHINALTNSLDQMLLTDFIDSRIVTLGIDQIKQIIIYRGAKEQRRVRLRLSNSANGGWSAPSSARLSTAKVEKFLSTLVGLKSHMILDRSSLESSQQIKNYLKRPLYTLELLDWAGESRTYRISHLIKKLDSVKIEERENFIISASDRMHPYLLHKDRMNLFTKREWRFR
ncbi:MAG: DUF4340 domain-containing protein [Bdellovibrionales bacterium]|jgi:hypothetical protein|nr:DUF4340 domain-containing protein [Bdellovibrionales bacterium]MBT3526559.1 DUF4340 domain-containing protein [Bdellovibrionales bacterium]MBT7668939.1 DUF4340 domain-containing protein [Bdellovibrionales bacterium]MBT7767946.1 DUF4340 domain-containing protein [Bdellovibrionales bacterium]